MWCGIGLSGRCRIQSTLGGVLNRHGQMQMQIDNIGSLLSLSLNRENEVAHKCNKRDVFDTRTFATGPPKDSTKDLKEWREWIEKKLKEEPAEAQTRSAPAAAKPRGRPRKSGKGSTSERLKKTVSSIESSISNLKKELHPLEGLPEPSSLSGFAELGETYETNFYEEPQPTIHPDKVFYPGQTYRTFDLDPFSKTAEVDWKQVQKSKQRTYRNEEIFSQLSFKNQSLLSKFVTDQGKLLPKRRTGLSAKAQRRVVRTIKLARQMALLPYDSKLPKYSNAKNTRPMEFAKQGGLSKGDGSGKKASFTAEDSAGKK